MAKEKPGFWEKYLFQPIRKQVRQGATPKALTWGIISGFVIAIFPILGTTFIVALVFAWCFRLNQPVVQSIGLLCYPLHFILMLPFIRLGEWLFSAQPVAFSMTKMLDIFKDSPAEFFGVYGMTCIHAIVGWLSIIPVSILFYPLILRMVSKIEVRRRDPSIDG